MLGIALDACVLVFLLKTINEDDVGFGTAFLIALVSSLGTFFLALGLASVMGIAGLIAAGVIAALLLAVALSLLFGMEIKRALLIGMIFILVHFAVSIGFQMMLRA